jgi:hypothetical protein
MRLLSKARNAQRCNDSSEISRSTSTARNGAATSHKGLLGNFGGRSWALADKAFAFACRWVNNRRDAIRSSVAPSRAFDDKLESR